MDKTSSSSRMLTGPLWNKILLYTLPLAATGILQQLFNAADMAVVGRFTGDLGPTAMAAVGSNAPVVGLALNTFMGISLGSNVVIANSVGSGDDKTVKKAVHTSVLFAVLAGIVITVFAEILSLTQLMEKYDIQTDRIYFDRNMEITLFFGEARVFMGNFDNIDDKMIRLQYIIPKLKGMKGVLHMENYSQDSHNDYITFKTDE